MKYLFLVMLLIISVISFSQDTEIPIHIEGKVFHPDGETPFSGVEFQLFYNKTMVNSMVTDTSGTYNLPMKKLGDYYLVAIMNGFDNDTIKGVSADIYEPNISAVWYDVDIIMDTLDINKTYQIDARKSTLLAPYPNPTNGIVKISSIPETSEILLLNMFGSVLNTIHIEQQKSLTIDLTNYPTGIYFLTYVENGMLHAKKLMKN